MKLIAMLLAGAIALSPIAAHALPSMVNSTTLPIPPFRDLRTVNLDSIATISKTLQASNITNHVNVRVNEDSIEILEPYNVKTVIWDWAGCSFKDIERITIAFYFARQIPYVAFEDGVFIDKNMARIHDYFGNYEPYKLRDAIEGNFARLAATMTTDPGVDYRLSRAFNLRCTRKEKDKVDVVPYKSGEGKRAPMGCYKPGKKPAAHTLKYDLPAHHRALDEVGKGDRDMIVLCQGWFLQDKTEPRIREMGPGTIYNHIDNAASIYYTDGVSLMHEMLHTHYQINKNNGDGSGSVGCNIGIGENCDAGIGDIVGAPLDDSEYGQKGRAYGCAKVKTWLASDQGGPMGAAQNIDNYVCTAVALFQQALWPGTEVTGPEKGWYGGSMLHDGELKDRDLDNYIPGWTGEYMAGEAKDD